MKDYDQDKIISLERQILLLNMAIAGIRKAPKSLQATEEFRVILNHIEKRQQDSKRAIGLINKKYEEKHPTYYYK
jgi:hypothetical protein